MENVLALLLCCQIFAARCEILVRRYKNIVAHDGSFPCTWRFLILHKIITENSTGSRISMV